MNLLEKAIRIAVEAHDGQKDKAGEAYILHPLRVMLAMTCDEERIVAVLHDVLEDTSITADILRAVGFSTTVVEAVQSVSRRSNESYNEFIERAKMNSIGLRVKLADLRDNCDLSRLKEITPKDIERLEKYKQAIANLLK